ncbi:hypothetical protein C8R43DRAFT_1130275 [Mycena crocata]|nr:hypothetical protein C8R43DRAFT_1130275 [Mycena crocata]
MEALSNVSQLPGSFPALNHICEFTDSEGLGVAKSIAPALTALLADPTQSALGALFHPDAFWRDHVSLSWSLRTFHPLSVISDKVIPLIQRAKIVPASIILQEDQVAVIAFPNGVSVVRAPFAFSTSNPKAKCTAAFKLVRMKNEDIRVFTLTTAIQELDAMPWKNLPTIPEQLPSSLATSLDVLVVGGGHGGLSISGYLKALGVNFAMVDKQTTIGDSWSKRYDSATLHTTRIFSGLPFVPFPEDYPEYVPAKLIPPYYVKYVQDLQLPAYLERECVSAVWDDTTTRWMATLKGPNGAEVVSARNLLFAVGTGGRLPIFPNIPGRDTFLGESMHSATYQDASRWAGKRVAVIGASTTACDVAHDCSRAGAEIFMIQRGPTRIYPQAHIASMQAMFWNAQIPVEVGDAMATEDPVVLQAALTELVLRRLKEAHDPEYYEGLRKAGFRATVDGPIQQQIFCRGGAHYPDIGACEAISRGEIKVKSDAGIVSITPSGLVFSDGMKLDVDVIVYCTGFHKDSRTSVEAIVGAEQTAALEPVWGLDAEGEVRGCWRPSGHDHIWFQGGELQTMRYFGKFLALQVAAEIANVRPAPCRV